MTEALTLQMLGWLDEEPRSYAETIEAWKTSCPRLSIWEDALADGLSQCAPGGSTSPSAGARCCWASPVSAQEPHRFVRGRS
jgi:hypothetical protein